MPLEVYTARLTYAGVDRLDISHASTDPVGRIFAPSTALVKRVQQVFHEQGAFASWREYDRGYQLEMGSSYLVHRKVWDLVLSRTCVTLVCFCPGQDRCHRSILARLLAGYGASDWGERTGAPVDPSEQEAFDLMLDMVGE